MATNRNKKAIDRIVQRLSREWQKDAGSAISRLYDLLDSGKRTSEAISVVRSEYPKLFTLTDIRPALVEAAAYGYGIVPSVLTSTQKNAWSEALAKPWDAGGLTLSAKLHGADVKMREAIADTLRDQMNRNAAWTDAATALYDGYGKGNVVRTQELPRYLSAVRYATKGSPEALKNARRAIANIEQLARKGSPTKALKASYMQLIDAAKNGTAEELEKACRVAIEEKSRYVAQRIIRTETARAYTDGFVAEMDADDDVVAVRLRLSTRHPVFDICDFFADADMYGLGKGVYPKDKAPPIPLHPHCMCRLEEVFSWELDISKAKNQVKKAGDRWLSGLSARERREVLGIAGDKAWKEGESWEKYLRNWKGLAKPETRLKEEVLSDIIKVPDTQIYKSVGAKAKNYDVLNPTTGEIYRFVEGTRIQNSQVFAGKGGSKPLYENVREGLTEQYGGTVEGWQHCKGIALLDCGDEYRKAEVHWFQHEGIDKIKFKVKRWKDED